MRQRVAQVCLRAGRDPKDIVIVAVSKGRGIEQIRQAIEAGITDIGENKVQEALTKYNKPTTKDQRPTTIKWHMVGHLQTNKAKDAVKIFDLIQSVDSLHLAAEINKQAAKINKVQDILIEVNTSAESSKFGLRPEEVSRVMADISKLKNINPQGLMTIAPLAEDPERSRPYFRLLKELGDTLDRRLMTNNQRLTLSMGMSDDFEIAIEEGATMVRIGRAIFEE